MSDDSDNDQGLDMFTEPDGFYEPDKEPTFVTHRMLNEHELTLRLVGHNPLWGHHLWNAGRTLADYLESNNVQFLYKKDVLELGAGAGLPSLVAALHGAQHVVVTDYPDADLIANLRYNIEKCIPAGSCNIHAEGYLWGARTDLLASHLQSTSTFDLLILADLLFNHSEHAKLLSTVKQTLKKTADARALVCFTPYRPWLLEKDLAFFELARDSGFVVEKTFEKTMDRVMFEEDPGDELLRRTVFGYTLQWPTETLRVERSVRGSES